MNRTAGNDDAPDAIVDPAATLTVPAATLPYAALAPSTFKVFSGTSSSTNTTCPEAVSSV